MSRSNVKPKAVEQVSEALSDNARYFYKSIQGYRYVDAIGNPLTRGIFRKVSHMPWEKALTEIDFSFQSENLHIGGVPCVKLWAQTPSSDCPIIIYVHGGGFVAGGAMINAATILPVCFNTGYEAYSVEYSLAPEHKYPVQLNQIMDVYAALRQQYGVDKKICFVADSAGCTLVLATLKLLQAKDEALPYKTVFLSPCLDGLVASDTMLTLSYTDPLLKYTDSTNLATIFRYYAGDVDVGSPEISPIYADMAGLPEMLIHVGSREGLLGDSARLSEKARQAKVPVTLRVFDGMFHLFHMHWSLPETKAAHDDIADFLTS